MRNFGGNIQAIFTFPYNTLLTIITMRVSDVLPFLSWIRRYNSSWLLGDVLTGITVAMLVIPQSLAYAKLAGVPPEFGLYSSVFGLIF